MRGIILCFLLAQSTLSWAQHDFSLTTYSGLMVPTSYREFVQYGASVRYFASPRVGLGINYSPNGYASLSTGIFKDLWSVGEIGSLISTQPINQKIEFPLLISIHTPPKSRLYASAIIGGYFGYYSERTDESGVYFEDSLSTTQVWDNYTSGGNPILSYSMGLELGYLSKRGARIVGGISSTYFNRPIISVNTKYDEIGLGSNLNQNTHVVSEAGFKMDNLYYYIAFTSPLNVSSSKERKEAEIKMFREDQEEIQAPETKGKFAATLYLGGPTFVASAGLSFYVSPKIETEIVAGYIGVVGGVKFHFYNWESYRRWTPYSGFFIGTVGSQSVIELPVGYQYRSDGRFSLGLEAMLSVVMYQFPGNISSDLFSWGGIRLGYQLQKK